MNYREVHPATLTWWAQRDQCRACAHYLPHLDDSPERGRSGERCGAVRAYGVFLNCIDARLPEAGCGPEAKLFVLAASSDDGENSSSTTSESRS